MDIRQQILHFYRVEELSLREISLLKKNVSLWDCQALTGTSINTLRKLKSMYV